MNNPYLTHLVEKIKLKESEYDTIINMIQYHNTEIEDTINIAFENTDVDISDIFPSKKLDTTEGININNNLFYDDLYKQLALKSHPDKVGNDNGDFIIIKEAYEKKDIIKLLYYHDKYNLNECQNTNVNILSLLLHRKLHELKEKVKKIKSTLGYQILICDKDTVIESIKKLILLKKENERIKCELYELKESNMRYNTH
jgi:hypothetical protein